MDSVADNQRVLRRAWESVRPGELSPGDEIAVPGDPSRTHRVLSVDRGGVVVSADDEIGVIWLDEEHAKRQAATDEFFAVADQQATAGGGEAAVTAIPFDGQDHALFDGLISGAVTVLGKVLPDPINPLTGNGFAKSLHDKYAYNLDIPFQNKTIALKDIEPGDILLKQLKVTWEHKESSIISALQQVTNPPHPYVGASLLTHATLYIGNGKVLEAVSQGVGVTDLLTHNMFHEANYLDYQFYVIRCNDKKVVEKVLQVGRSLVRLDRAAAFDAGNNDIFDQDEDTLLAYSFGDLYRQVAARAAQKLLESMTGGFLANAISETVDAINTRIDMTSKFADEVEAARRRDLEKKREYDRATDDERAEIAKQREPNDAKPKLFCSELIVYCYHRAVDLLNAEDNGGRKRFFRQLRQNSVSPEELYVLARGDTANFTYKGELPARVARVKS